MTRSPTIVRGEKIKHRRRAVRSRSRVNRSRGGNAAAFVVLCLLGAFMVFPMIYVVGNAFKPLDELFKYPPELFVHNPTLDNFRQLALLAATSWVPFSRYFFNTFLVTVAGTLGNILLASLCAYALAKRRFPGARVIFKVIVLSLMFSAQVTAVPTYLLMTRVGLLDTYWAIILPAFQSSLGLYLMKQFIETVPNELLEAAQIDGAGQLHIFFRLVMPMVKPAWLTLCILSIQSLWNVVSPYTYSEQLKTLPQALSQIAAGGIARTGVGSAVALVMLVVPVFSFVVTQSNVIETMSTSGLKG